MAVEFDDTSAGVRTLRPEKIGAVTRLFMRVGLAKTPKGAQIPMLIALLCAVALSVYLISSARGTTEPVLTPEEEESVQFDLARSRR